MKRVITFITVATIGLMASVNAYAKDIVHDTEYYILEAQNGEKWAKDDEAVDRKLAEFKNKNGGKPPNILYILIDDIGFGDLGIPELNKVRGYKTPNINEFAREGMRFVRMYTEPSCTPTRAALSRRYQLPVIGACLFVCPCSHREGTPWFDEETMRSG